MLKGYGEKALKKTQREPTNPRPHGDRSAGVTAPVGALATNERGDGVGARCFPFILDNRFFRE
jgi:hypothetical protein